MKVRLLQHWPFVMTFVVIASIGTAHLAHAITNTTPQRMVYNGHLLSAGNTPITTPHTIRFSLWYQSAFVAGDTTGTGAVNTSAPSYAGWKDAFTVTPDSNGFFTVELGSHLPFPDLAAYTPEQLRSLFLQIEVKPDASPLTAYELLDANPSDPAVDRAPILSVPFALNADMVDQRHVGSGSGSITVLGSGGLLNTAVIPGGTNAVSFTIDQKGLKSSGTIDLTFGGNLGKKLSYDIDAMRFTFNDQVNIQGNLTVNGLINGVDITQITATADNSHLKVSSGAGLSVAVARGDYRLSGIVHQFPGSGSVLLQPNATNYLAFTASGLTISTSGFPLDQPVIQLATVLTSGTNLVSIVDRRIFNANDMDRTVDRVFQPQYEGAAYEPDGSNNVGQLIISHSGSVQKNYYRWTSSRPTLQDYDIVLTTTLPHGFVKWNSNPFSLSYRSATADSAMNALSIQMYDTAGHPVTLSGQPTTNLANVDWQSGTWTFDGSPVWTPGKDVVIRLKVAAQDGTALEVGPITLRYMEGPGQ